MIAAMATHETKHDPTSISLNITDAGWSWINIVPEPGAMPAAGTLYYCIDIAIAVAVARSSVAGRRDHRDTVGVAIN